MNYFAKSILSVFKFNVLHYVVCIVPCCPIRRESSHRSEMVSELLFGETAEVIESGKEFSKVRCMFDDYEGWVQTIQMTDVDTGFVLEYPSYYTSEINDHVLINDTKLHLSLGTPIFENCFFGKNKIEFPTREGVTFHNRVFAEKFIKQIAFKFLNTSYLWGGRSSFGVDCSGFTQQVFKMFNKKLLRDAYQQATQGEVVNFLQEAKCGDLAFFDNEEGRITHVGILINQHEIIHSSGCVKVDKIDTQGIINSEGKRTHKLRIIKRI